MKNRRVCFTGIGQVAILESDFTAPTPLFRDDLVLRTEYTLISPGTELAVLLGKTDNKNYPQCLGYSAVATVLQVGAEATGFQPGDRVLVYHSSHSQFLLKNKADCVKIPAGLASEEAIFAVVGAMGFQGVRKIRPELGEAMLVMGLGLLGQLAVQTAALSGAFPLLAMDYNPLRRELACKHGADIAYSPGQPEVIGAIKDATRGRGVNGLVEVTGSSDAIHLALKVMAPQGRIALVGCSRTPTQEIDFYHDVHRPGIQLLGAHNFVRPKHDSYPGCWTMVEDMRTLLELTAAGRINTRDLITDIVLPERALEIYQRFMNRDPGILGVLFDWRHEG